MNVEGQNEGQTQENQNAGAQSVVEGAQGVAETAPKEGAQAAGAQTPDPAKATPGDAQAAAQAAAAAFKPNFKLKIMDQEKEIPEAFRSLIKDEKTEKEVREIFEKSYGIEFMKPKYETLKTSHAELQTTHNAVLQQISDLRDDYARGDLDSFFDKLKIPTNVVLQYALKKVQYQELPEDQKSAIDRQRQLELENRELMRKSQMTEQQFQTQVVQARAFALDTELARPDVKSMAEQYEARTGQPGSFRAAVISLGQLKWQQSQGKVDLSPGQAIEELVKMAGLAPAAPASATTTPAPAAAAATPPQTTTIPNVGGSKATSPVGKKPKSIEDLKKLAAEANA